MAAYAAVVSLRHIIEQMQQHPRLPIYLDRKAKKQVESLYDNVTFLQDFLENYSFVNSKEFDAFESRIVEAAYAAEDIIESHIVDQIQIGSKTTHGKHITGSIVLYYAIQKVIQDMDLIKRDVSNIKERMTQSHDQLHANSTSFGSSRSTLTTMVGFDDVLIEVMDKLTGQQSKRQIIPIVGMGGIGKTTLARNIYVNPLIVQHFDFCGWATISQEYNVKEIFLELILCIETKWDKESLSQMSEHNLGEKLYKSLSGRRYLIVMDDLWGNEVWDKVKFFFPDDINGSKIIITTRVSNLISHLSGSDVLKMSFLDEDKSWNLLCKSVFGKESCPLELEEIGKKIAKNCKGLPLSIVVIGGLLAKSNRTQEHWQFIAENLNSILNLEDNERCSRILRLSYNQLPIHLKPCFLYMGMFPEDTLFHVSYLIMMWVAEGFLKPISGKSLEVVAKEYLIDLIDRNLIVVKKSGTRGDIKHCTIHDLLRDLCLREADKVKFFRADEMKSLIISQGMHNQRRIGIHRSTSEDEYFPRVVDAVQSASLARSLICNTKAAVPVLPLRLLRVLNAVNKYKYFEMRIWWGAYPLEDMFQLVNARHLAVTVDWDSIIPSSVYDLWNLQTLVVNHLNGETAVIAPFDIWKMPQLRHVKFYRLHLPDPPIDDGFILWDLQTLQTVDDFKCTEEVVRRIPNIKTLHITYVGIEELSPYCLDNLCRLRKLEFLACFIYRHGSRRSYLGLNLNFPHSLKKLTLRGACLQWEDMGTKLGLLPHLQVLKLYEDSFMGPEWETFEGQFRSLKFLQIKKCHDLKYWTTDSTHFPCLEKLILCELNKLEKIPVGIGDIPTLLNIKLKACRVSAVLCAKEILKEQEELGNKGLQVRVVLYEENQVVESLATRNFQVEIR